MSNLNLTGMSATSQNKDAETFNKEKSKIDGSAQDLSEFFKNFVENVNEIQTQAYIARNELDSGQSKNIEESIQKIEQADDSLKLMMQVRSKMLDAYYEIMRMQT